MGRRRLQIFCSSATYTTSRETISTLWPFWQFLSKNESIDFGIMELYGRQLCPNCKNLKFLDLYIVWVFTYICNIFQN